MKKLLIIASSLIILYPAFAYGAEKPDDLLYFYSTSCDKCMRIKAEVMPGIEARFKDKVSVAYKDIGDIENYKLLFELKKRYSKDEKSVFPVLSLNGNFIDERGLKGADASEKISSFITDSLGGAVPAPLTSEKPDPVGYFKKFTLPAVILAGLIDGINPCSFTVLVFFMSFISMQRYDRKIITAAGCAFILAAFLTYLAIGLGVFGPLYAAKGYRNFVSMVTAAVGVLSISLGAASLYDALIFLKTKRPEDSILKLPAGIKGKIHKLIGDGYRAQKNGALSLQGAGRSVFKVFFASLTIGFLISMLESVCTGQLYLPTIIFVLKSAPYKLQALLYLLTYNIMFIIPLIVIFLLALAGVSSQSFAAIFRKYFFIVKIFLALLFLTLGASIVFAEEKPAVRNSETSLAPKIITSEPEPKRQNDQFYWNFGKVKEGTVLKHKFFIINDTKDPFNIKQINTSCACTVSTVEQNIIFPGKKAPIYIEFKTKGYPGERTRYTYVHTDSEKVGIIVFEIRAEVMKADKSQ